MKSQAGKATPELKAMFFFLCGTSNGVIKKMSLVLSIIVGAVLYSGCEKSPSGLDEMVSSASGTPGESIRGDYKSTPVREIDLITISQGEVGTVRTSFNDEGTVLTVVYEITMSGRCMNVTHLDVQVDPANFPLTSSGNPKVGKFAYGATLDCALEWTQVIDLTTISGWLDDATIYVAANAVLNDNTAAWGKGERFPGHAWAMYFSCKASCPPSFTYEGQTYTTTVIGDQCWMAENLNVGTMITALHPENNEIIEKYCYDDDPANCEIYGGMYEWWEMMAWVDDEGGQGICPPGWHVPTREEFLDLGIFLGENYAGGGKLKEEGFAHWEYPNTGATNSTGFTALPGGYRYKDFGETYDLGLIAHFWSSTPWSASPPGDPDGGWRMDLQYNLDNFGRGDGDKHYGFSVRCLKNN
jgi:uncharacterized protein (TIGR02145 family)